GGGASGGGGGARRARPCAGARGGGGGGAGGCELGGRAAGCAPSVPPAARGGRSGRRGVEAQRPSIPSPACGGRSGKCGGAGAARINSLPRMRGGVGEGACGGSRALLRGARGGSAVARETPRKRRDTIAAARVHRLRRSVN